MWYSTCSEQDENEVDEKSDEPKAESNEEKLGFKVKSAVLFPPEVENGMWPENYSLSDHACLTVVLSPVRLQ